jgi:hypothetical protein
VTLAAALMMAAALLALMLIATPTRGVASNTHAATKRPAQARSLAAHGTPATEIARQTGLSRDALALLLGVTPAADMRKAIPVPARFFRYDQSQGPFAGTGETHLTRCQISCYEFLNGRGRLGTSVAFLGGREQPTRVPMTKTDGIASAASALRYWERRQEVAANNLANANTDGFKAERIFARLIGDALPTADATTDRRDGTYRPTGQELDLAVGGDGFFVMGTKDGERWSRGGALTIDPRATLSTPTAFRR